MESNEPEPGSELEQDVRGAAAGVVATSAMTGVLLAAAAAGLIARQPPVLIVKKFLPNLPEPVVQALSWLAHFGYGASGGVLYRLVQRRPAPANGVLFALALWAASYEGWIPVAGIMPPVQEDNRSRVATMVAGHVVYGTVLGALGKRRRR